MPIVIAGETATPKFSRVIGETGIPTIRRQSIQHNVLTIDCREDHELAADQRAARQREQMILRQKIARRYDQTGKTNSRK